jgi:hypothetical protein
MTVAARRWTCFFARFAALQCGVSSDRKSSPSSSVHKTSGYDCRPSVGGGGLRWACVCVIDEKWSTRRWRSFTLFGWIFPRCEFAGDKPFSGQRTPHKDERELRCSAGVENFSHCQNDLVLRAGPSERQGISRMSMSSDSGQSVNYTVTCLYKQNTMLSSKAIT